MLARLPDENTACYKHFSAPAELSEVVENDLALLFTESFETANVARPAEFSPRPLANVPVPRNPLLGREHKLGTICQWLSQDGIGQVTLTGTDGTGKSRLSLEAAFSLRDGFADGVYLVRLTPASDPGRVVPTVAETLGLRESAQGRPPVRRGVAFLRSPASPGWARAKGSVQGLGRSGSRVC